MAKQLSPRAPEKRNNKRSIRDRKWFGCDEREGSKQARETTYIPQRKTDTHPRSWWLARVNIKRDPTSFA